MYSFGWNQTVIELCSSKNTWSKVFSCSVLACHLKISFMKLNLSGGVNQWLLAPVRCQQESPIWGAMKKETFFSANNSMWYNIAVEHLKSYSSIKKQHDYGTACLQGGPLPLDSSVLLYLLFSASFQKDVFGVSTPAGEM